MRHGRAKGGGHVGARHELPHLLHAAITDMRAVAKSLAQDEYEDFPVIQDEITIGATDVEVAAKQLNEATVTLVKGSADDRPGAWDSLGEAVRVMAQETSILLHIVYGAEIKKIFALSNYADGKLKDLLKAVENDLQATNPQLFANKVSACMEDVQKLVQVCSPLFSFFQASLSQIFQGIEQKASEETDDPYARKTLEEAATTLSQRVQPFVDDCNKLLQQPNAAVPKQAVIKDLEELIHATESVGAPNKKPLSSFIPELMECIAKMDQVEPTTPEGQKQAARALRTLDDLTRANVVHDGGPRARLANDIVDVSKDLDQIESMLKNPDSKPLGSVNPLDATDPHTQNLLNSCKRLSPDERGRDAALADAEKLKAIVTNDLLPLARKAYAMDKGAARDASLASTQKALENARATLEKLTTDVSLTPEQKANVKNAEKVNTAAVKVASLVGASKVNKREVASAAKDLETVVKATEGAKAKPVAVSNFIPELLDCMSKMEQVELTTPEGQKEAERVLKTLDDITRANRVQDMGPATDLLQNVVALSKDLDQMESLLANPGTKPLGNVDPMNAAEPHAQGILNYLKRLQPDEEGGRDAALADAEKLNALLTNDLLPLARKAHAMDEGAARNGAVASANKAIEATRAALDAVVADMGLTAEQKAHIKGVEKINTVAIKLGAMVGSKKQAKQDIFSAAKNLTDLLSEMGALLALSQGGAGGDEAQAALLSAMSLSGAGKVESQPKPVPKPGSAKQFAKKIAGPAKDYRTPEQKNLVSPDRGSTGSGYMGLGADAEELKTLSLPKATKGAEMMPDTDPVITGVRKLGEQLVALSNAARSGDNDALLKASKACFFPPFCSCGSCSIASVAAPSTSR